MELNRDGYLTSRCADVTARVKEEVGSHMTDGELLDWLDVSRLFKKSSRWISWDDAAHRYTVYDSKGPLYYRSNETLSRLRPAGPGVLDRDSRRLLIARGEHAFLAKHPEPIFEGRYPHQSATVNLHNRQRRLY